MTESSIKAADALPAAVKAFLKAAQAVRAAQADLDATAAAAGQEAALACLTSTSVVTDLVETMATLGTVHMRHAESVNTLSGTATTIDERTRWVEAAAVGHGRAYAGCKCGTCFACEENAAIRARGADPATHWQEAYLDMARPRRIVLPTDPVRNTTRPLRAVKS